MFPIVTKGRLGLGGSENLNLIPLLAPNDTVASYVKKTLCKVVGAKWKWTKAVETDTH